MLPPSSPLGPHSPPPEFSFSRYHAGVTSDLRVELKIRIWRGSLVSREAFQTYDCSGYYGEMTTYYYIYCIGYYGGYYAGYYGDDPHIVVADGSEHGGGVHGDVVPVRLGVGVEHGPASHHPSVALHLPHDVR
jgi:hypothetical protein